MDVVADPLMTFECAGEHNTSDPAMGRVIIYRNEDNSSSWTTCQIDSDLEHHDGTRLVDVDNDGDFDILSIGWTHSQVVLYENKASDGGNAR